MARPAFGPLFAATIALTAIAAIGSSADAAPAKRHRVAHASVDPHHHHHHHRHHHPAILHRANQAASVGDRHVAHPETLHHGAFGAPVFESPPFPTPYPFDGRLAGDGILRTGILDSNVLRQAYGIVRN